MLMSKIYSHMRSLMLTALALIAWAAGINLQAQETVTYTVKTTSSVECSETTDPFGASYSQTYSTAQQLTANQSATLTLSSLTGYKIEKIVLNMHNNSKAGAGTIAVKIDDAEVYSDDYPYVAGTAWKDVEITPTSDWTGDKAVITIKCTTKSLYINTYTITYSSTSGVTKEDPGISFDVTSFNAVLEEQATTVFPELNDPNGVADFTWSSSNPTVATVDAASGAITMLAVGQTVITATFEGDTDYKPGSASYTLKVTSSAPKSAGTIVYTVASKAVTADVTPDPFEATYSQTANNSGQMTANNSTTLVLNNFDGYAIESIVLNMHNNKSAGAGTITVKADETQVYSDDYPYAAGTDWKDVTLTPTTDWTGSKLTIYIEASANSIYINTYTINYKPVGGASREEAELSFATEDFSALIEDNATTDFPALVNPHNVAPIVWSSSNTDVATIDASTGAITLLTVGSTVITASFEGDASYKAGEASYTLNVDTDNADAVRPATYTVSSTSAVTCNTDPDPFEAEFSQTYGSTAGQMTGGNSTTLTLKNFAGFEIDHVVLSMKTNKSAGAGNIKITVDDETYYDAAYNNGYTQEYKDYSITGNEGLRGDEIKIFINATVNSLFVNGYTIYYKTATGAAKKSAELSFDDEEFYVATDEAGTAVYPTLVNPNSLSPITWSSSNEDAATIDASTGEITVVAPGTTVIKAAYAGNSEYLAGEAKYTLQVWDGIIYEKAYGNQNLAVDDVITFVDETLGVALSTTQGSSNRPAVACKTEDGKLNVAATNIQALTLGGSEGAWTLSTESGKYLYATGTANGLKTGNKDTATVAFEFDGAGGVQAHFTNIADYNYIYCNSNSGTPIWSSYKQRTTGSSTSAVKPEIVVKAEITYNGGSIYRKAISPMTAIDTPRINTKEDSIIYDIYGHRVTGKLQPGVYIRGGKKILITDVQN